MIINFAAANVAYGIFSRTFKTFPIVPLLVRDYENASQPPISFYVAYFPTQKTGDTIHSPDHCLPGAGWIPISREVVQLARLDGSAIPVNRYVVSRLGEWQLVLYWFQAYGRCQRLLSQILSSLRFDSNESQRRSAGAPDDPYAQQRVF